MNEQGKSELISHEVDAFFAKLLEYFSESDFRREHMGTILGYSIERFIEICSHGINDYNQLSKSFLDYLKTVHENILKEKQKQLN